MTYTFRLALGLKVGKSLVEPDKVDVAKAALEKAKSRGVKFMLPVDNIVATPVKTDKLNKKGKPIIELTNPRTNDGVNIPDHEEGVDIGPKTVAEYAAVIRGAKTILWNGPMGIFEMPAFAKGTFAVASAVVEATEKNGAKSIVGGGDSVKALNQSGMGDKVTFMSTGGGASLEFLEGKVLPGAAVLAGQQLISTDLTMKKDRKLIIAGNWKMNKTGAEALDLVRDLKLDLANIKEVDIVVCPPFTALSEVSREILSSNIRLGAQNMSEHNFGAYTGEIAAGMLKEFSVRYVILGHSERRQYQKESDALISKKALAAHVASIKPIVCVGEVLAEREGGQMEKVLETQVRGSFAGLTGEQMEETIVAYEPVWAIGTGKTATAAQAQEAHLFIRKLLGTMFNETVARRVRIQYGGSVKPSNAAELMGQPDVDGALVGGASLETRSFADIIKNSIL